MVCFPCTMCEPFDAGLVVINKTVFLKVPINRGLF